MAVKKTEEPAEPKRKSKLKIIILILVPLLLAGGGGTAFWWLKLRTPNDVVTANTANTANTNAAAPAQSASAAAGGAGNTQQPITDMPRQTLPVVSLPTVTVNLMDAAETRYLKVGMEVEVSTPDAVQAITAQRARIQDAIIILLSSKTYANLATAEGKMQIKNEIAARLNQILGAPRVVRVYFTDFIVQ